jgi:hypothetical protein
MVIEVSYQTAAEARGEINRQHPAIVALADVGEVTAAALRDMYPQLAR